MEREELKGKQTLGDWFITEGPQYGSVLTKKVESGHGKYGTVICQRETYPDREEKQYDAGLALIAEAGTVANRTGMWPLDMVQRIKELEAVLSDIDPGDDWTITPDMNDGMAFCEISVKNIRAIRALIKK